MWDRKKFIALKENRWKKIPIQWIQRNVEVLKKIIRNFCINFEFFCLFVSGYWRVDCQSASKGLFLGLLCLVGGIIILIIFFVMKVSITFGLRTSIEKIYDYTLWGLKYHWVEIAFEYRPIWHQVAPFLWLGYQFSYSFFVLWKAF